MRYYKIGVTHTALICSAEGRTSRSIGIERRPSEPHTRSKSWLIPPSASSSNSLKPRSG
jgi:hypothetical protein